MNGGGLFVKYFVQDLLPPFMGSLGLKFLKSYEQAPFLVGNLAFPRCKLPNQSTKQATTKSC